MTSTLDKSHMVLAIIICTITKCSNLMLDRWHLMITTWWQWQSLMMSQETTSLIARQGHCALEHNAALCTLFCTNQWKCLLWYNLLKLHWEIKIICMWDMIAKMYRCPQSFWLEQIYHPIWFYQVAAISTRFIISSSKNRQKR